MIIQDQLEINGVPYWTGLKASVTCFQVNGPETCARSRELSLVKVFPIE